jgi:hypothetical protein
MMVFSLNNIPARPSHKMEGSRRLPKMRSRSGRQDVPGAQRPLRACMLSTDNTPTYVCPRVAFCGESKLNIFPLVSVVKNHFSPRAPTQIRARGEKLMGWEVGGGLRI